VSQDFQPDEDVLRYLHQVNFISAEVNCTACIRNGRWEEKLSNEVNCDICGDKRTFTWSKRDFHQTQVDQKYIVKNPLRNFVKWILYYFNENNKPQRKYHTVALAHNGVLLYLNNQ